MKASRIYAPAVVGMLGVAVLLGSSLAQPASAPAVKATKVAVCDVGRVFDNYARRKELNAEFMARADRLQQESDKKLAAIESIRAELSDLMVGSEAYESRLNEAERLAYERKSWIEHQTSVAERDRHRLTLQVYQEIVASAGKVAKSGGIDIVIYRKAELQPTDNLAQLQQQMELNKVIYAAEGCDITEAVLLDLNQGYAAGPR